MTYKVRGANIIGITHRSRLTNGQDAYGCAEDARYIAGLVCDGMGSGEHSEVFAHLTANYLPRRVLSLMNLKGAEDMEHMSRLFWHNYTNYLDVMLQNQFPFVGADYNQIHEQKLEYIHEYMMHTLVLLVVDKLTNRAWTFSMGDGFEVVDDEITDIGSYFEHATGGDVVYGAMSLPVYGARGVIAEVLNQGFRYRYLGDEWQRIAVLSDGFRFIQHVADEMLWWGDQEDEPLSEDEPDKMISALQAEWTFSARQMQIRPEDDLSGVTVERLGVPVQLKLFRQDDS